MVYKGSTDVIVCDNSGDLVLLSNNFWKVCCEPDWLKVTWQHKCPTLVSCPSPFAPCEKEGLVPRPLPDFIS